MSGYTREHLREMVGAPSCTKVEDIARTESNEGLKHIRSTPLAASHVPHLHQIVQARAAPEAGSHSANQSTLSEPSAEPEGTQSFNINMQRTLAKKKKSPLVPIDVGQAAGSDVRGAVYLEQRVDPSRGRLPELATAHAWPVKSTRLRSERS